MQFRKTDSSKPKDWFDLAADRLKIADLAWAHEGLTPTGIECLQESVERYLKGYLIAQGWTLQKTHDLENLVRAASQLEPAFSAYASFAVQLTEDFFAQHYPGGDMTNLGSNYESLRKDVTTLIELIKTKVPQYF